MYKSTTEHLKTHKTVLAIGLLAAVILLSVLARARLADAAVSTVSAQVVCTDAISKLCRDSSDVIYATCRTQKGSISHCRDVAEQFFYSCLADHGCNPFEKPPDAPGTCDPGCWYDFRMGMCRCNDESQCGLFDEFGPDEGPCLYGADSPVIADIDGHGIHLTSAEDGVLFDIRANGSKMKVAWTETGSEDAWLVLDRNGNGTIDNGTELFGNYTPQTAVTNRNGFAALKDFDANLDGEVTAADPVYQDLRLWQDKNHNGISEPEELHTLAELSVYSIEINPKESRHRDRYGNQFRYRAKVNSSLGPRFAYDVFLTHD